LPSFSETVESVKKTVLDIAFPIDNQGKVKKELKKAPPVPIEKLIGVPEPERKERPISDRLNLNIPPVSQLPARNTQTSETNITQNITIDGNVTDVSRNETAKVTKQLQAHMIPLNQVKFGANVNRQ